MTIPYDLLKILESESSVESWHTIFQYAWDICSKPLNGSKPEAEITRRDRAIGDLDLFLTTAGWDLWRTYEVDIPRTSKALVSWWESKGDRRAVLILDALSLRELPWLLKGAEEHGFNVEQAKPTGAELPADTTPFAKSLGFGQRSSLNNDGASGNHKLSGAKTESVDIPWKDCHEIIGSEPDWVFWHHWPDHRLHDHDDPGKGLTTLTQEVQNNLESDDFWHFVERLAHGRKLVITADHGYAASELFPDSNREQTDYLKGIFKSGRWDGNSVEAGSWAPPIDLLLDTDHGEHLFVLGRRKWRSAGGYPTLTHGGLSVLEVVVPFIELSSMAK